MLFGRQAGSLDAALNDVRRVGRPPAALAAWTGVADALSSGATATESRIVASPASGVSGYCAADAGTSRSLPTGKITELLESGVDPREIRAAVWSRRGTGQRRAPSASFRSSPTARDAPGSLVLESSTPVALVIRRSGSPHLEDLLDAVRFRRRTLVRLTEPRARPSPILTGPDPISQSTGVGYPGRPRVPATE